LDFPFAGDGFIQQQSRGPYDCPLGWVRLRLEVTQDLKWFLVRFNRQNNSNHAAASIYENDIDIQNRVTDSILYKDEQTIIQKNFLDGLN
jgi:hypothetical protein